MVLANYAQTSPNCLMMEDHVLMFNADNSRLKMVNALTVPIILDSTEHLTNVLNATVVQLTNTALLTDSVLRAPITLSQLPARESAYNVIAMVTDNSVIGTELVAPVLTAKS